MKIKFVHDGIGSSSSNGDGEFTIEMKTIPHAGDRLQLANGKTVEVVDITHMANDLDFVALVRIRASNE